MGHVASVEGNRLSTLWVKILGLDNSESRRNKQRWPVLGSLIACPPHISFYLIAQLVLLLLLVYYCHHDTVNNCFLFIQANHIVHE